MLLLWTDCISESFFVTRSIICVWCSVNCQTSTTANIKILIHSTLKYTLFLCCSYFVSFTFLMSVLRADVRLFIHGFTSGWIGRDEEQFGQSRNRSWAGSQCSWSTVLPTCSRWEKKQNKYCMLSLVWWYIYQQVKAA